MTGLHGPADRGRLLISTGLLARYSAAEIQREADAVARQWGFPDGCKILWHGKQPPVPAKAAHIRRYQRRRIPQ